MWFIKTKRTSERKPDSMKYNFCLPYRAKSFPIKREKRTVYRRFFDIGKEWREIRIEGDLDQ